jgi:hypothetical protein
MLLHAVLYAFERETAQAFACFTTMHIAYYLMLRAYAAASLLLCCACRTRRDFSSNQTEPATMMQHEHTGIACDNPHIRTYLAKEQALNMSTVAATIIHVAETAITPHDTRGDMPVVAPPALLQC